MSEAQNGDPVAHDPGIVKAISTALKNFGRLPLEGGALAQAWMPVSAPDGRAMVLQTKGLPYSIVGPGDMLALFRCLSCKYSFSANLNQLAKLGAPGRVFLSGEAETSDNVQHCNMSIYLRVKDAQACRVSSSVLLPVFADADRKTAVAVLEVTQFDCSGATYQRVFDWARSHLETAGLYTPRQLETRTFEMQSHALSIRFFSSRDTALGCTFHNNRDAASRPPSGPTSALTSNPSTGNVSRLNPSSASMRPEASPQPDSQPAPADGLGGVQGEEETLAPNRQSSADSEEGVESPKEGQGQPELDAWGAGSSAGGAVLGAGHAKPGLTREDLQRNFGYGLKEAAKRLGVCNTTLKRACRRHGIMKWPRRELLKHARLQREAAAKVAPDPAQGSYLGSAADASRPAAQYGGLPTASGGRPHFQPGISMPFIPPGQKSPPSSTVTSRDHQQNQDSLALQRVASPNHEAPVSSLSSHLQPLRTHPPPTNISAPQGTGAETQSRSDFASNSPRLQWQALPPSPAAMAPSPLTSGVDTGGEDVGMAEPQSARRGSPGLEGIFNEADNVELGSMLGEWEQQFAGFRTPAGPQTMAVVGHVVAGGAATDRRLVANGLGPSFPDVPDPWPVEPAAQAGAWSL